MFGATGLLGSHLVKTAPKTAQVVAFQRGDCPSAVARKSIAVVTGNISNETQVQNAFLKFSPDIVIDAAGEGSVDRVQMYPGLAQESIAMPTKMIAAFCHQYRAKLLYLSSNAVFDGKHAPYSEGDVTNPVNLYGQAKVQAELRIKEQLSNFLIVRPILSLGWPLKGQRGNPLTFVVDKLRKGEKVMLVDDVYENPISAQSVADCCWSLLTNDRVGVFHVGGADRVSRVRLGHAIAEVFELDSDLIERASSADFSNLAPRPRDTTLNTIKTQTLCSWRPEALQTALQRIGLEDKT